MHNHQKFPTKKSGEAYPLPMTLFVILSLIGALLPRAKAITQNAMPGRQIKQITTILPKDTVRLKQNIVRLATIIHQSVMHIPMNGTATATDSLLAYNDQLETLIKQASGQLVDFMNRDFLQWANAGVKIITAEDKRLRIICWNDALSGTNQEWIALAVTKNAAGQLLCQELTDKQYTGIRPTYQQITTIEKQDGSHFYLVTARGHEDNRIKYDFIKAYKIMPGGTLNDQIQVFNTNSASQTKLNTIGFEIDLITSQKAFTRQKGYTNQPYPLIHLSRDKQMLYIPIIKDNGTLVSGSYLRYKFDGQQFVYQSNK